MITNAYEYVKKFRRAVLLPLILMLVIPTGQSASNERIVNGDFETGDLTGWNYENATVFTGVFPNIPRWNFNPMGSYCLVSSRKSEISQVVNFDNVTKLTLYLRAYGDWTSPSYSKFSIYIDDEMIFYKSYSAYYQWAIVKDPRYKIDSYNYQPYIDVSRWTGFHTLKFSFETEKNRIAIDSISAKATTNKVFGNVTDNTSMPIANTTVTVEGQSNVTDITGHYEIYGIHSGTINYRAKAPFYYEKSGNTSITADQFLNIELKRYEGLLQGNIRSLTGETLEHVNITTDTGEFVSTGNSSKYSIYAPPGWHNITVSHPDYIPRTENIFIEDNGITYFDFVLQPDKLLLPDLSLTWEDIFFEKVV